MRSKPRGHALIININKTENLRDREGSEIDLRKLKKLFKDLGYRVVSRSNLNLKVSIIIISICQKLRLIVPDF